MEQGRWQGGFLEYTPESGDVTISVRRWLTLCQVDGLYFVRPRSIRMVYQYLREVGLREVLRKIRSRNAESLRNRKFLSVGLGIALCDEELRSCVFIAPMHPEAVDRLSLPACAVRFLNDALATDLRQLNYPNDAPDQLLSLAGWSPHSGLQPANEDWEEALDQAIHLINEANWSSTAAQPAVEPSLPSRQSRHGDAVLYGYGNYAKLYIIPNVVRGLQIDRICDIDPVQLPRKRSSPPDWGTEARPGPDDAFRAYFIAGYHHSHAEIAIAGLQRDAAVVVEKPIAVDQDQLDRLLVAIKEHSGRFFAGYHKRYSQLTQLALADLAAEPGAPIDYHCVVYEVPLPKLHWYRWPNSHSRIVSNGCHWLDHFLFVNGYPVVSEIEVFRAASGAVSCAVELSNGAIFTMSLTENGSERLGVRDHIEMRYSGRTVTITDGSRYFAEQGDRVLRRARVNKVQSYVNMYREISRRILAGEQGDTRESVAVGGQLVIDVELRLSQRYGPSDS